MGVFLKFGVEESSVNALNQGHGSSCLTKSYAFTRVVRFQSTLQRQLRRQILKNTLFVS
jgi:hypothetical protein